MFIRDASEAVKTTDSYQVALWLGLSLLDLVLSIVSLSYGALEANPMLRWMHEQMGLAGFSLYKLGLAALVIPLLAGIRQMKLLWWLNIGLVCICLYTVAMLIKTFS